MTVEWEQSAQIVNGREGDLYDGFVSFHLLDLARGMAANFFVGNDLLATVYARLPFPGASVAKGDAGPRFFAWFEELAGKTAPGQTHAYAIEHDAGAGTLTWRIDDGEAGSTYTILATDFDGDGRADLALRGDQDGQVRARIVGDGLVFGTEFTIAGLASDSATDTYQIGASAGAASLRP